MYLTVKMSYIRRAHMIIKMRFIRKIQMPVKMRYIWETHLLDLHVVCDVLIKSVILDGVLCELGASFEHFSRIIKCGK